MYIIFLNNIHLLTYFSEILEEKIDKMEQDEIAGKGLSHSLVGRRRIATTWAVGKAWERFCTEKKDIIIRSFRTVGLALPVDGSADMEISIKGLETGVLVKKLENWQREELEHIEISEQDDENETVEFEAGLPKHCDM